jgi:DNA-binding transcriptional LysR family regulator
MHAGGLLIRKLLPAWLRRLKRSRPDIAIELSEADESALRLLRSGATDLVVDFVPEAPPDIVRVRVATTHAFVVLHASHPLAGRKDLDLPDLGDETFIGYPRGSTPFELQMSVLGEHGIVPSRMMSLGSADSILGFVEAGVGWSIIPWLERGGPRSPHLRVRPLRAPRSGFPVHAAFRKSDAADPLIAAVVAAIEPS